MSWNRELTKSEKYQKHMKEAAEALRTSDVDELKRWRKDMEARLSRVEAGTGKPDPLVGDIEAPEIRRLINQITARVTHLNRVAAGGTDWGREAAEKGTSPVHAQLRDLYADLDRMQAENGDPTETLRSIGRLKKVLAEGPDFSGVATAEEALERKRGERRYAGL